MDIKRLRTFVAVAADGLGPILTQQTWIHAPRSCRL